MSNVLCACRSSAEWPRAAILYKLKLNQSVTTIPTGVLSIVAYATESLRPPSPPLHSRIQR